MAQRMYKKLKAADPSYPVTLALGETGGHVMADPAHSAVLRGLENDFVVAWGIGDGVAAPSGVFALPTRCHLSDRATGTVAGDAVVADTWNGVATDGRRFRSSEPKTTSTFSPDPVAEAASDYNAAKVAYDGAAEAARRGYDAGISLSSCLTRADAPKSSWSWPVDTPLTMVGLPKIRLDFTYGLGKDATITLKLWDHNPATGSRTLVARGVARLVEDDPITGRLTTQLSGNHWTFASGNSVELEIAQTDAPTFRPNNLPSRLHWSAVDVRLPERS